VSYRDAGGVREEPWWYMRFKVDESQAQRVALSDAMAKKADQLLEFIEKKYGEKKISHRDYPELYRRRDSMF
jgi:hypothetical protein